MTDQARPPGLRRMDISRPLKRKDSLPNFTAETGYLSNNSSREAGCGSSPVTRNAPIRKWFDFTQPGQGTKSTNAHEISTSAFGSDWPVDSQFTNPRAPAPVPVRRGRSEGAGKPKRTLMNRMGDGRHPTLKHTRSFSSLFNMLNGSTPNLDLPARSPVINKDKVLPPPPAIPANFTAEPVKPMLRMDTAQRQPEYVTQHNNRHAEMAGYTPATPNRPPRKSSMSPPKDWLVSNPPAIPSYSEDGAMPSVGLITKTSIAPSVDRVCDKATVDVSRSNSDRGTRAVHQTAIDTERRAQNGNAALLQVFLDDADQDWKIPRGFSPTEAALRMPEEEKKTLRQQAIGQAEQFEVLGTQDVAFLTRELQSLNERCEYLRRTQKSLRFNRRKMQSRLITYLKSDALQFSRETLLRQEEALVELDKSVDGWMLKLEQAENRKLRVRQKLLEHFAAAMTLGGAADTPTDALIPFTDAVIAMYASDQKHERPSTASLSQDRMPQNGVHPNNMMAMPAPFSVESSSRTCAIY